MEDTFIFPKSIIYPLSTNINRIPDAILYLIISVPCKISSLVYYIISYYFIYIAILYLLYIILSFHIFSSKWV